MKLNITDGPVDIDGDGKISAAERCVWLVTLSLILFVSRYV